MRYAPRPDLVPPPPGYHRPNWLTLLHRHAWAASRFRSDDWVYVSKNKGEAILLYYGGTTPTQTSHHEVALTEDENVAVEAAFVAYYLAHSWKSPHSATEHRVTLDEWSEVYQHIDCHT